jgi:hypothetical protein
MLPGRRKHADSRAGHKLEKADTISLWTNKLAAYTFLAKKPRII